MIYFCCDERRRDGVREHATLNGIDFLEVFDQTSLPFALRQRTLFVHFIKPLAINSPPDLLTKKNVRIEGGERIHDITVESVTVGVGSPIDLNVLAVEVSEAGDFSTYTLRLVKDAESDEQPAGFDPVLSNIDFSFKVTCDNHFDCEPQRACPPEPAQQTEINYLAKDYASFRQLMLDRLSALAPAWKERNQADLGIAIVELLAYVGDYLSYQQDAVATESYIGTARRRVSIRRHARLVDYPMHDGRNARALIQIRVRGDINGLELKRGKGSKITKFFTRILAAPPLMTQDSPAYKKALESRPQVFELIAGKFCKSDEEKKDEKGVELYAAHNEMKFYTWGARKCCLPKGATRATLRNLFPNLKPGDVLIFVEVRGPDTGKAADANPANRHAVRLTEVTLASDPLGGRFEDPETDNAVDVTEIEWDIGDALPFPLCISSRSDPDFFEDVSIALGNIVLADHGQTFTDEPEGRPFDPARDETSLEPSVVPAPDPALTKIAQSTADRCEAQDVKLTPPRYNPRLSRAPLTQAAKYDPENPPASASATIDLSIIDSTEIPVSAICLSETGVDLWEPRRDLLSSGPSNKEFVVEIERDSTPYLRFGDDQLGSRPAAGTRLLATYRIGNGAAGNVGADSLAHIVSSDPAFISDLTDPVILSVTNPLAARGGIDAETIEQVRQNAPSAFRRQERAVTPEDYAEVALRCDTGIQRAAATFRWTGSWRTVFVTVDRFAGDTVSADFEKELRGCLERFRMAGQDLEVDGPIYVPLEIQMVVCVKRDYFTSQVEAALLEVFSNRVLPDGRHGVFHPDNFTFGQAVYLSSLYAGAQSVAGVDSVDITVFQRQGIPSTDAIDKGWLELGRLEIARLDNDPNFPERGVFSLDMRGGR